MKPEEEMEETPTSPRAGAVGAGCIMADKGVLEGQ